MSSSETLDFVVSVTVGRLSRAVLSRVETRSFNTVKLNSHPESLRQFDEVFSDEKVRGLVKTIRYDAILPVVSDKRLRNKFQSTREATENSRVFTEAIAALFTRLSCWEQRDVKLTLTATSPSDDPILRTANLRVQQQRNEFKYISIETSVLPPGGLPLVSCISFLDIQDFDSNTKHRSGRRLHPDAICAIAAKALPCLEHTIWDLYMPPRRMPAQRKEFKAALAAALLQPMYTSLATLTILLWDPDPRNEEAILIPDDEEDRLSLGMRRICELPTLVSLFLWGKWCISHRAFRRFGPSVRSVFVDMSMTTPDGGWLLDVYSGSEEEEEFDVESEFSSDSDDQGDTLPDIDSENSDVEDRLPRRAEATANQDRPCKEIREVPDPKAFTPLVTSFAQAVANTNSSRLEFAEMRLSAQLASMRLSYCGGAGGEDPRLGALPDFAQRIIRADKVDMNKWRFDAYGGITASGWMIPAAMWDAMKEVVGAENIDTNVGVDKIEGE